MKFILSSLVIGFVCATTVAPTFAAVSFLGGLMTEDFDSLPDSSQSDFFSLIHGVQTAVPGTSLWEGTQIAGSNGSGGTGVMDLSAVTASSTSGTGAVISAGDGSERALGVLTSGSFTPAIGVEIVNDSSADIASITISFTQELWRTAGDASSPPPVGVQNTISASWGTTDSGVSSSDFLSTVTGFTPIASLDLVSPTPDPGDAATFVDGNLLINQTNRTATINFSTPVGVGESLFLRFQDFDDDGRDAALAIDDFSISALGGLAATLNPVSGEVKLRNVSSSPISINRYQLDSAADALLSGNGDWNSFSDQNLDQVDDGADPGETWTEAGGSGSSTLAELFLLGSTTFAPGEAKSLGEAYNPVLGGEVSFDYLVDGILTTGGVILLGDMNGDGSITTDDVNPFVQALTDRAGYESAFPDLDADVLGDLNSNGVLDLGDVANFKLAVSSPPPSASASAVPEPGALLLISFALVGLLANPSRDRK